MSLQTQLPFVNSAHDPRFVWVSFTRSFKLTLELATHPSTPRLSWLVKLYENLTYVHMQPAAIQRQGYTAQCTTDNILLSGAHLLFSAHRLLGTYCLLDKICLDP